MNQNENTEYGCPLRYQSGAAAINDFAAILEQLPRDLRDAFEAEREERQIEFDDYVALNGYHT